MKKLHFASAALAAILAMPPGLHAASHLAPPASPAESVMDAARSTDGEVRKVDREARKITIRHAELKHLDMPPMTMVFRVKDPSLLDELKQGDKVTFVAEKEGGQFTVTHIEARH